MLNSRRAIVAAVFILTVFFLLTRSHTTTPVVPAAKDAAATAVDASKNDAPASNQAVSPPPEEQKGMEIKERRTRPRIDMSGMSIFEKLEYAYPYDVATKFPAYIWQTWKQSPDQGDFQFKDHHASWREEHPGFVHEVITDDVAVNLIRLLYATVPEVVEVYRSLPMPVLKADFFRYLILFARGGIYSDIDTYAIQSSVKWLPEQIPRDTIGLVIGIEADPDRPDWAQWYSRRIQFCQWTIQAKPGHPVLRAIITRIANKTLELKNQGKLGKFIDRNVVEFTGPAVWTDAIMEYFNDPRFFDMSQSKGTIDYKNFTGMETSKRVGDVVVLPITSFSPGVGQMGAKEPDDPMAFVKHDFEGTWKPESERHMGEQQQEGQAAQAPQAPLQ
ncbi:alpha 1,6-mannosyltransferase [Fusarium agapanthi]|uniref:Alpha 1,6-mannosyltransferase n=1 Tax=Fusarium agapanthi TaxID=1803897 RepID=A0A9P5E2T3_9HYPO|nr:alpha 1,6-mannosyltransferase [Fusarium agapanthi]